MALSQTLCFMFRYTRDKQKKAEMEEKRRKELNDVKSLEARAMAAAL